MKRIYVICPVRRANGNTSKIVSEYVSDLERCGNSVFYPERDVIQDDFITGGVNIVRTEMDAIRGADEVHIFWDKESKGSHFDLGVALALGKSVKLIHSFEKDSADKCYEKVIEWHQKRQE